jgi:hypothetical protein
MTPSCKHACAQASLNQPRLHVSTPSGKQEQLHVSKTARMHASSPAFKYACTQARLDASTHSRNHACRQVCLNLSTHARKNACTQARLHARTRARKDAYSQTSLQAITVEISRTARKNAPRKHAYIQLHLPASTQTFLNENTPTSKHLLTQASLHGSIRPCSHPSSLARSTTALMHATSSTARKINCKQ